MYNRLDKEGVLTVSSQEHRSQLANRVQAAERMADLIRAALTPPRRRIKTKVPKGAIRKRLENKKKRSQTKQLRSHRTD